MKRKITDYLMDWSKKKNRKPLILTGPRRIGKTYSILEFGREHYENVAYFNFETSPELALTFRESLDPEYLLPILSHFARQTIMKEKTLIVFDEIQLCEQALSGLKYFCEKAPEYHVIAAGSLLGVAVNRQEFSFPVGKVELKTMYPMDFGEFLDAAGEGLLLSQIEECFEKQTVMPEVLHQSALNKLREYLIVGGMPEAVREYVETRDFLLVRHLQEMILQGYLNDMSKYNTMPEIKKTRLVYESVTAQLSKPNTQFRYNLMRKNARAAEFESAIEWLTLSGIVSRVYRVSAAKKPLENYKETEAFKIYYSDCGLLCAKNDLNPSDILYETPSLNDFKGGLIENYVNIHLTANEYRTFYWDINGAEVDFVIQREGSVIPVEAKSSAHTQSKSLARFQRLYSPPVSIVLSPKNFGFSEDRWSIPLYAVFCL